MTMTLVSTVTVGSGGAANITFSSLPQTGSDILIVCSLRSDFADFSDGIAMQFNSNATGYTRKTLYGNGAAAGSNGNTNLSFANAWLTNAANSFGSTFGNGSIYIPNYSVTGAKSFSADTVNEHDTASTGAANIGITAGIWSGTAAITSLLLKPANGTIWTQYSQASLYTITKGSGGASVS